MRCFASMQTEAELSECLGFKDPAACLQDVMGMHVLPALFAQMQT